MDWLSSPSNLFVRSPVGLTLDGYVASNLGRTTHHGPAINVGEVFYLKATFPRRAYLPPEIRQGRVFNPKAGCTLDIRKVIEVEASVTSRNLQRTTPGYHATFRVILSSSNHKPSFKLNCQRLRSFGRRSPWKGWLQEQRALTPLVCVVEFLKPAAGFPEREISLTSVKYRLGRRAQQPTGHLGGPDEVGLPQKPRAPAALKA